MENATGAGKVSTREDRLHRGRKVTMAFLMQGWGQFFNQIILILLLLIFHVRSASYRLAQHMLFPWQLWKYQLLTITSTAKGHPLTQKSWHSGPSVFHLRFRQSARSGLCTIVHGKCHSPREHSWLRRRRLLLQDTMLRLCP